MKLTSLHPVALRTGAMILSFTVASAYTLVAQDEGGRQNPPLTKRDDGKAREAYASIDHMVGAPVYLLASAEAAADASREGEAVDRPKAKVNEWLLDSRSGELSHAVVSLGGFLGLGDKTVLVPANELTWNNAMERYDLGWTKDQLEAKPTFDLDGACKSGLDGACNYTHTGKDVADASVRKGDGAKVVTDAKIDGTAFRRSAGYLWKASEVASLPVYEGAKEWGKAQDLLVDRGTHKVVLAIVSHGGALGVGGDDYLVPFANLATAVKDGDEHLLCAVDITAGTLESCVKFEQPKNGVVDPVAAERALKQRHARKD